MNKKPENKKGGAQQESMLIKYYADQWCRDNGYPLQERRYNKTVSRRPSPAVLRSSVRSRRPDEGSNESGASHVSTCTESVGAK